MRKRSRSRDLEWGRRIHEKVVASRNGSSTRVLTAVIKMYAKCGSMDEARQVFDSLQSPDVVSFTALLLGYAENGNAHAALDLFSRMKALGLKPDSVTYVVVLKACTLLAVNGDGGALKRGREIHSQIGCYMNLRVQNTLIHMYCKLGRMTEARGVFESIPKPDAVSWNALLLGYAENGEGQVALDLFSKMRARGCAPNSVTYVASLKACASLAMYGDGSVRDSLEHGRKIHSEVGCHLNPYVQNTLIDMYSKCRSMVDARRVFDSMQKPNLVSWNALTLGYAENGDGGAALDLFSRMKASPFAADSVTYTAALKACTSLAVKREASMGYCLERGREIHSEIGSHLNHHVKNTLVDMYSKCGSMSEARRVFDSIHFPDVVSWTALLLGYAENGDGQLALDLFARMKAAGCAPDSVAYVAALKACGSLAVSGDCSRCDCLLRGKEIHLEIGCQMNHRVQNTLIDMYAKCRSMADAHHVFDRIQKPDVVSWNALLLGYAENGNGQAALDSLSRMKASGCVPNSLTYVAALKACGLVGALALGRGLHSEISDFPSHVVTGLVDFYAKCGSMVEAREVFDLHSRTRDVSTWTALLAGYSSFGDTVSVFSLFEAMQDQGFRPDAITLVCILLCCSHAGLVHKATEYFEAMPVRYGITPAVVHYNCMVDVLGRANHLNEALVMLQGMPCNPNAVTWRTLLGACRKWKNVEIGRLAFQSLVDMDKKDPSAYLLMAQVYGSKGMWEEQQRILESGTRIGAWKMAGYPGGANKTV